MKILGIIGDVNAGAALIEDGKILAAINEERINRMKLSDGFPVESIREVLRITNTKPEEIERVAYEGLRTFFYMPQKFDGWLQEPKSRLKYTKNYLVSMIAPFTGFNEPVWMTMQKLRFFMTNKNKRRIRVFLKKEFGITGPIEFVDHHFAHACGAYYTFGKEDAIIISLDGGGDGYCSRIYKVKAGEFENLYNEISYNSIGNYYAYITKLLGFKAQKHEGKITGLAAYGKPIYLDILRKFIYCDDKGRLRNAGKVFMWTALPKIQNALPKDYKREDVAASIQTLLEEEVAKYCEYWVKKSGLRDVVLVGGVFANVKLNQRVHELDCVDSVFVHPGMTDGGLNIGSAYALYHKYNNSENDYSKFIINDVYFGQGFTNEEIETELKKSGLKYHYIEDIESIVADLLAKGKVVARFNGRMEYGPRALGNRSILYQATDVSVNDWLNKNLHRTEFMPFAPFTMDKLQYKCYKNMKGAEHTAKFMTITFDCTDYMKEKCPAVVHVDGTARPQIIYKDINSSFYMILEEYYKITGLPALINTSFNMHEEPIVSTPNDAIRSFQLGHLDYLAIGDFLISLGTEKLHPHKKS
jgi:carbamoyltransferase